MTATTTRRPPASYRPGAPGPAARPRRFSRATKILAVVATLALAGDITLALQRDSARHAYLAPSGWPADGQASYQVGNQPIQASVGQRPVPIASVAKVMTAYLTLKHGSALDGPAFLTVTHPTSPTRRGGAAPTSRSCQSRPVRR